MKIQKVGIGLICFFAIGCLTTQKGQRLPVDSVLETEIQNACKEMSQIGDIFKINQQIQADIENILEISDKKNPILYLDEIESSSKKITENLVKVRSLLRPEWNQESVPFTAAWKIGAKELLKQLPGVDSSLKIHNYRIRNLIFNGKDQPSLLNQVRAEAKNNEIEVNFSKPSSIFELCYMQNSLSVIIEVQFSFDSFEDFRQVDAFKNFKLIL